MMKEEVKAAVVTELQSRKLTEPMTEAEMTLFCQEIYKRLQFKSKNDRLVDIRNWADRWQSTHRFDQIKGH